MKNELLSPFDFESSAVPMIGKTSKVMSFFLKEKIGEHGIDMTREQFILLKVLHKNDGVKQKDLAFITERNKGSLARLISTMEKKNFVARIPSETDKRVNCIHLTKHGRAVFKTVVPIVRNCIEISQHGLTAAEIETVISVLQKIQNNLENELQ